MRFRPGMVWVHAGGIGDCVSVSAIELTKRFKRDCCGENRDFMKTLLLFDIDPGDLGFISTIQSSRLVIVGMDHFETGYRSPYHHQNDVIQRVRGMGRQILLTSQVSRTCREKARRRGRYELQDMGFNTFLVDIITTSLMINDGVLLQSLKGHTWSDRIF